MDAKKKTWSVAGLVRSGDAEAGSGLNTARLRHLRAGDAPRALKNWALKFFFRNVFETISQNCSFSQPLANAPTNIESLWSASITRERALHKLGPPVSKVSQIRERERERERAALENFKETLLLMLNFGSVEGRKPTMRTKKWQLLLRLRHSH